MEYEFTFVVDGATVDDDSAASRLESELDAMLARAGGQNLLSVSYGGDNAVEAAMTVAHAVRDAVPGLRLLRLDRDLVGVQEIAERTERSRQNVHQWTLGARLADKGPFPQPEGTVGRGKAWLWTEVNAWLVQHSLDDGINYPTRREMTDIDFFLANSLSFSFQSTSARGFDKARQAVTGMLMENIVSFSQFALNLPLVKNGADQHVLLIAGPKESAHSVMRFIADAQRDLILVTAQEDEIVGVHFSVDAKGPQEIVQVGQEHTVWSWMDLVREKPTATFVAECALPQEAMRIRQRHTLFTSAA
ncbi:hypothetical protein ABZ353_09105 [Streptomyces niveus]|uniref:helix-turn-helix transcriptional regulator n=1 Tax=Streptomyces niveus TaxID=193462 RepID=UPI003411D223